MQAALDRDKGYKGKRSKKSQKRVRRSGKKNKRKKEKDLTPDRTTESLFEELLQQGIIKFCPEVRIDNFKGQNSYSNFDLRQKEKDPLPAIGEFYFIFSILSQIKALMDLINFYSIVKIEILSKNLISDYLNELAFLLFV